MKMKKMVAALCTSVLLASAAVVGVATAANADDSETVQWDESHNHPGFWKDYGPHEDAECYKHDANSQGNSSSDHGASAGSTVTLATFNQSWPGDHWELLVIKAGTQETVVVHPDAGKAYTAPENKDVSHWIVCKGTTPTPTTTTPPTPTPTPTTTTPPTPKCITAAWSMPGPWVDGKASWPQKLVGYESRACGDLTWPTPGCGVQLQIDSYNDNAVTTALLAGKVLNSPNNPPESLWKGGTAWKFIYGGDCPPVDVCPNLDGAQATVPVGYTLVDGECITPPGFDQCETTLTHHTATNLNQQGWNIKPNRGEFVNGGLHLYSTADSSGWAQKTLNAPFSKIGDLTTNHGPATDQYTFGVILTLDDWDQQIHYDADGRYWTDIQGIFPDSTLKGGFYETYDLEKDLLQPNLNIQTIILYINAGHGGTVIHTQNYLCGTQPFDYVEPRVAYTPKAPTASDVCGVDEDTLSVPSGNESGTYTKDDKRVEGVGTVTVTFTPSESTFVPAPGSGDTYKVVEGKAVWTFEFTNEKCPTTPPVTEPPATTPPVATSTDELSTPLAYTGNNPLPLFEVALGLLLLGVIIATTVLVYRRREESK